MGEGPGFQLVAVAQAELLREGTKAPRHQGLPPAPGTGDPAPRAAGAKSSRERQWMVALESLLQGFRRWAGNIVTSH